MNLGNINPWLFICCHRFPTSAHDPGNDNGINTPKDAMSFALGYYNGDYNPIGEKQTLDNTSNICAMLRVI